MVEKRQTKRETITEGRGYLIGGTVLLGSTFGLHAINFLSSSTPATFIELGVGLIGSLCLSNGATAITVGNYFMDSSTSQKSADVSDAQFLVATAGIGLAATAGGLAGAWANLAENPTTAGLLLATVPMSAGVTRFLWNKARKTLQQ